MPKSTDNITHYDFFKKLTALPFVQAIYLYGSRARGDNFARSDIDLAVDCTGASTEEWHEITRLVDQENIDTLLTIDVKRYDTLPQNRFKVRLDNDKQILYQKVSHEMNALWKDSLEDLGRALDRFQEVLAEPIDRSSLVLDASIQRFEFCTELFWKTLKRMLADIAGEDAPFPKLTLAAAYRLGWIDEQELWIAALKDRNLSSHIYNEAQAIDIYQRLGGHYQLMRRTYTHLVKTFLSEPSTDA